MFNLLLQSLSWEAEIIVWLQRAASDFTILLNQFLSCFGEELLMVAVLGIVYWGFDKQMGEFIGFNLLTTNVLNPMVKNIAQRPRPYIEYRSSVKCLKPVDSGADLYDVVAQGYSFPSGHSSSAAALYPSFPMYDNYGKRYKILIVMAVVIPLLVGISRVFLGVHFPTDVLGGWALGLAVVILMTALRQLVSNKYIIYLATAGLALVGMIYCRTNDYFTSLGMLLGFLGGVYFEEKVTKFHNTDLWWRIIIRVLIGGGLFFALNVLLKLPVSWFEGGKEWLESTNYGQFVFRTVRYAIILFLLIGVYPLSFRLGDKIFTKFGWIKATADKPVYKR